MNTVFMVEESNLISIFASKNRRKVMQDISNAISHLDDEEMIELSLWVADKPKAISDEGFAKFGIEAAE